MPKLVAIGDSLTQGFQSFAVGHANGSFPVMVAEAMGLARSEFRIPDFSGRGGLPCNLEWLARKLQEKFGAHLATFEWPQAIYELTDLIDEVEEYWERGPGSQPVIHRDYHNLAVWGFEVADSYSVTAGLCEAAVTKDVKDDTFAIPSEARLRTAYRVLNPSQDAAYGGRTQIEAAKALTATEGQIEHLILWLGANNCLGTVLDLDVRETGDQPPGVRSGFNLWSPKAFQAEYEELATRVQGLAAGHVYVGTVPHVTIPPITRGVMKHRGRLPEDRKYYDYYTRFWIQDKDFDPERDPSLTAEDAELVDQHIDHYNAVIRSCAKACGWRVVETCKLLDDLAVRRNHGRAKLTLPPPISDLSVRLFETSPDGGILSGGLISLDGVHPTRCGYGLVAQLFIDEMNKHGAQAKNINFAEVRRWDTLVSCPPRTLDDMLGALRVLERYFHLSRWISPKVSRQG